MAEEQKSKFGKKHRHMTPDGAMTGPDVELGNGLHTHSVMDGLGNFQQVSPANDGMGHTHRIPGSNQETFGPK